MTTQWPFFGKINERSVAQEHKAVTVTARGLGTPALFLHGLGSCADDLAEIARVPALRSLCAELPGFGRSDEVAEGSLPTLARRLLSTLNQRHVQRALWVGCSFGGHVALRSALDHPHRVAGLILISSGGLLANPDPELAAAFNEQTMAARSQAQVRLACQALVARKTNATEAFVERRVLEHSRRGYHAIARSARAAIADQAGGELERIIAPTLILHGEKDPLVPLALAKQAAERIPGARLQVLKGIGHMPWLECPELVREHMNDFINETLAPFRAVS